MNRSRFQISMRMFVTEWQEGSTRSQNVILSYAGKWIDWLRFYGIFGKTYLKLKSYTKYVDKQ